MSISKKKSKSLYTNVYYHSKKNGKIAIRLIGKYLYDYGFKEDNILLVKISKNKIVISR